MARGEKFCTNCNARNGPRAWNCKACGTGFTVKGIKYPDIPVTTTTPTPTKEDNIDKYFNEIEITDVDKTKWGPKTILWESPDGNWRIRFRDKFHGVNIDDGKPYILLRRDHVNEIWDLAPVKHRFKKLSSVIREYLKRHKERNE